jgi:hypothetical protein
MELDEQGRVVRRPPPPGHRGAPDAPGFPEFEHNQWTFEGQIERLSVFARGVGRAQGLPRRAGVILTLTLLVPIAVGLVVGAWSLIR